MEVVVATLLTGLLTIGALETVGAVALTRQKINQRLKGHQLAQSLLAEILKSGYADAEESEADIGIDASEDEKLRSTFDDVDDFHDWRASPPMDANGVDLEHCDGWTREVSVSYVRPGTLIPSVSETGLKLAVVTVTAPNGEQTQVSSLRTAAGAGEQEPSEDATVVRWIGAELQLGKDSPPAISGTNLVNHGRDNSL